MICLEGCFLCCLDTEMILTEEDIRRLESLGYEREDFSEFRDGFIRLKNVDGRCFFLKDGKCSIYEYRPLGCRAYPVIFDLSSGKCTLDELCPARQTVSEEELEEKCRLVKRVLKDIGILT
ncbi:MAG: YkgJ family cysteine cluster protein [Thermoproteota archaeon]|nr:MAG: YkgJ family cysteine cluster protein [Candidatus Korarchaeota archaeon]